MQQLRIPGEKSLNLNKMYVIKYQMQVSLVSADPQEICR